MHWAWDGFSSGVQTCRDAIALLWHEADAFAKRKLILALALVASAALLIALAPIALKLAVDRLATAATSDLYAAPIGLVIAYVLSQYLGRVLNELRLLALSQAEQRVRRRIGLRVFSHLVHLPLRFHQERKTGAVGETAEEGLRAYQLLLTHLVYTILPITIELVAVAIVLSQQHSTVYLFIMVGTTAAYAITFVCAANDLSSRAEKMSASHIESHAVLTDSLLNYETVKYFDAEPIVCHRYDRALRLTELAWTGFFHRRMIAGLFVATIFAISLGASLVIAGMDALRGAMTVGGLVLVNSYVLRLAQPVEQLGFAIRDISQSLAFLRRMLAILGEQRERDAPGAVGQSQPMQGELVFEHVSFRYHECRTVLEDVSFAVPAGKTVAIVGVSGSGKSSLIRLLFRLYEVDDGRILLDGVPVSDLSLSYVRQAIAVVPQDTVLFHDTIASNIALGRFGASHHDIVEAARVARLHDAIMAMPEGYETVVGERGLKLSGGERQRVAIARAALKRPRIFVFDEATSSLDSNTEREILLNILEVSRKCSTLVIAHRLSTIVHADEILVLNGGVISERGTHAELRTLGGYYAGLWDAQQTGAAVGTNPTHLPLSGKGRHRGMMHSS